MSSMRATFGVALVVFGCSASDFDVGDASDGAIAPVAVFARADVESDLRLTMTQALAAPFEDQRDPRLDVELENRSAARSYAVVLPDDGSDAGWREPRVGFTLEGAARGGEFEPFQPPRLARCGLYAVEWGKDVRILAPGERVRFEYLPFYLFPEDEDLARVRIVAHYSYGEHTRDLSKVPPALHSMPSYTLDSNPVELDVGHPYELRVRTKGAWPADPSAPLAEHFDVVLENRSPSALPYESPDAGAHLSFEVELAGGGRDFFDVSGWAGDLARETIRPGEQRSLLGPRTRTGPGSLFPPREKALRLRVRYQLYFEDADTPERRAAWSMNQRVVVSDWIELDD